LDIHHASEPADRKTRLVAGVLTSVLYALFVVLIWHSFLIVPATPATPEIVAQVLPDTLHKKIAPLPPPLPVHLIKPHSETIAPQAFTVASAAPAAPALLPASAAKTSPITGGAPSGSGTAGQSASANGTNGNGSKPASCLDPAWLHALTKRVMPFVNYPSAARRSHTTGVVILHFVVSRTGLLDVLEVSRSSGNQALDDAASQGMSLAQPLPPIPDHMNTDRVDEHYEVTFGAEPIPQKRAMNLCGG
jgi:protein TonB